MKKRAIITTCAAVLAAALCTALITAGFAAGTSSSPVAENLELTTYRGVSVGGRLSAVDPDGDVLSYEITTKPAKGTVELSEDGSFVYTPDDGKKGRDYFGYKAVDSQGNYSQEATVIIKITKQKSSVTYADMEGSGGHYAAISLAEHDIYKGECVGGKYIFNPNKTVSRGEFLSMCMKLTDRSILSGVKSTGFSDDSDIPMWVKPYVSTALMSGIISGYSDNDAGAVFCASNSITWNEAAVMLDNIMGLSDVVSVSGITEDSVPSWSYQATVNLSACDIMACPVDNMDAPITRVEAAQLLANALAHLAK